MEDSATPNWNRPQNVIKMRKMKVRKRALQGRLCLESEPPKKRSKHFVKRFEVQPPPDDEETCEDSTLMDLICMRQSPQICPPQPHWSLSASSNSMSQSSSPLFTHPPDLADPVSTSPPKLGINHQSYVLPSADKGVSNEPKKRRQLVPTPVFTIHSPVSSSKKLSVRHVTDSNCNDDLWSEELCQDWSVKTELRIVSLDPFTWSSSKLKLLEESSGTSAFVRCTDYDPPTPGVGSSSTSYQLDGSQCVGAQFQQCRLYWQFPYLPDVCVFPRMIKRSASSFSQDTGVSSGHHYDEKVLTRLYAEWIEAFRSVFQLIRARQCPYFYLFTNQFTCLFCSPGIQANEEIQVSITPATSGFRQALANEGIEFTMPYYELEENGGEKADSLPSGEKLDDLDTGKDDSDDEHEHTRWLNDLGVSQDVSCSTFTKAPESQVVGDRNKAKLVVVAGSKDTLLLFNFLMNSKQLVVASSGHLAGIPPTILAPVAFVGASLRNLQTKQSKFTDSKGCAWHSLDLQGPILPQNVHMLSTLMLKTIKNFRLHVTTLHGLECLNFLGTREKSTEKTRPSAFHIQSLSDCGLGKTLLSTFCRSDNVATIKRVLECVNGLFRWK